MIKYIKKETKKIKTTNLWVEIAEIHKIKKKLFFNKYEMVKISAEKYAKNCVDNIIDKGKIMWLRYKNLGKKQALKTSLI